MEKIRSSKNGTSDERVFSHGLFLPDEIVQDGWPHPVRQGPGAGCGFFRLAFKQIHSGSVGFVAGCCHEKTIFC
ncbi:MAG: hypothetical protein R2861_04165 [Desulfobacterales bacterium]